MWRLIAKALFHFAQSAEGGEITSYHLQAGIAACHCTAKDYESTDWMQILRFYDQLVKFDHSPVVALNRTIVVANIHGPTAGLAAVEEIPAREKLNSYYLLHAVVGDLNARLDQSEAAAEHFRKSLNLAETTSERTFLTKRIYDCASQASLPSG